MAMSASTPGPRTGMPAPPRSRMIPVTFKPRTHADVVAAAEREGMKPSAYVRAATLAALRRSTDPVTPYQEIVLPRARVGNMDATTYLEIQATRRPLVRDLCAGGNTLSKRVRMVIFAVGLPPAQARRMVKFLQGDTIAAIGRDEGASRQAVHKSVMNALDTLMASPDFLEVLKVDLVEAAKKDGAPGTEPEDEVVMRWPA